MARSEANPFVRRLLKDWRDRKTAVATTVETPFANALERVLTALQVSREQIAELLIAVTAESFSAEIEMWKAFPDTAPVLTAMQDRGPRSFRLDDNPCLEGTADRKIAEKYGR